MEITIDDYNQNVKALQEDVIGLLDEHFQSVPESILVQEVTTIIARYFAQLLTLREKENIAWTTESTRQEVLGWIQGATMHALLSYQKDGILQPLYQEPLFAIQNGSETTTISDIVSDTFLSSSGVRFRIIDGGKE